VHITGLLYRVVGTLRDAKPGFSHHAHIVQVSVADVYSTAVLNTDVSGDTRVLFEPHEYGYVGMR
jgi:hypothetical protein